MAGLLLILLFAAYLLLAFWLIDKINPLWKKGLVLMLLILIPTADEIYYSYKLKSYCETEAGLKIYKQVSRKMGLVDPSAYIPSYLKSKLVSYVERYDENSKKTYRFERQEDGTINKLFLSKLTAPYEFVRNEKHTGAFLESELKVFNRETGEILGKLNDLNYYGGWFRHGLLGKLSDSGGNRISDCGISEAAIGKIELINKVFSKK